MKLDALLEHIGQFGPYQKRVFILTNIPAILTAAETLSVIFIFAIPNHRCQIPGLLNDTYAVEGASHSFLTNLTIPSADGVWDSCHVYTDDGNDTYGLDRTSSVYTMTNRTQTTCHHWVYDRSVFESTIATDFDVVCDRSIFRAHSNILSELGTVAGIFVGGILSDRFGRKLIFFLGGLSLLFGGVGIAFVQSLPALNLCRFILGCARQCVYVTGMVLGLEFVGPSWRTVAGMTAILFWCIGGFFVCLMSYFIRDWRHLEIAISIPGVVLLAYWWLVPESPRWLASRGENEKALKIFQKIADSNQTTLPFKEESGKFIDEESHLPVWYLYRSRELVKRFLIIAINIFINVVAYYGVTLNITNLNGDIFINFILMFSLEVVALPVTLWLLYKTGRKPVCVASIIIGGSFCTLTILPVMLNAPHWVVMAVSMVGRFFVIQSFSMIYLYGAELFPTSIRTSAIGTCIAFSRLGNLVSPLIADLGLLVEGPFRHGLPLLLMGVPAILVGLLSLYLPETRNTTLPETIEGMENISRKSATPEAIPL